MKKKLAYFAEDGNYGTAVGMEVLDTAKWTAGDWQKIENASDSERVSVAKAIDKKRTYYPL
jgi:hypothetical protein